MTNDKDNEQPHNLLIRRMQKQNTQSRAYRKSRSLERAVKDDLNKTEDVSKLSFTNKKVKARVTAGSGNKLEKGDVRRFRVTRIEHKATEANSFRVTKDMVSKIENAAMLSDETPAIVIEFLEKDSRKTKKVAVIPYEDLLLLLNK